MTEIVRLDQVEGLAFSATSIEVTDPNLSFESYTKAISASGIVGDTSKWWLGDLLLFGEARYGEAYAQILDAARLNEHQARDYRYVAQQVARSRRRENLPFSHHREVAPLPTSIQDDLLARSEAEGWSREQLRDAVREARAVAGIPARQAGNGQQKPVQEVLGAPERVDAARNLSTVREALVSRQDDDRVPAALVALDEVGATLTKAAKALDRPSILEAARAVVDAAVRQTGLADPAYIVPSKAIDELAARVAEASEGSSE